MGQTSVVSGWLPLIIQMITAGALIGALLVRPSRWWLVRLPIVIVLAAALIGAVVLRWIVEYLGYGGEPAPFMFWFWGAMTGSAVAVVIIAWPKVSWRRRIATFLPIPLCLLSVVLLFNVWVGYARTTQGAWQFLTDSPLPNQVEMGDVRWLTDHDVVPKSGRIVPVTIGDEPSGFRHRGEYVYLPPVWFTSTPPPPLPVVVMVGGAFGSSADWLRAGKAQQTADAYAKSHGGSAPVLVFVDKGGLFNKDTQCVNGTRGNAADHVTQDVIPFMTTEFGVSQDSRRWAIAGWSMGGTCAVTLAVKYPDLFGTFVAIDGAIGPSAGSKEQTVSVLFGGDEDAWASFDPTGLMQRHGRYDDVAGVFAVATTTGAADQSTSNPRAVAARSLSGTASAQEVNATILDLPGASGWDAGAVGFQRTFDWLAGRLQVPGIAPVPQPGLSIEAPTSGEASPTDERPADAPPVVGVPSMAAEPFLEQPPG